MTRQYGTKSRIRHRALDDVVLQRSSRRSPPTWETGGDGSLQQVIAPKLLYTQAELAPYKKHYHLYQEKKNVLKLVHAPTPILCFHHSLTKWTQRLAHPSRSCVCQQNSGFTFTNIPSLPRTHSSPSSVMGAAADSQPVSCLYSARASKLMPRAWSTTTGKTSGDSRTSQGIFIFCASCGRLDSETRAG